MKLTIESVSNGYILSYMEEQEIGMIKVSTVVESGYEQGTKEWADKLQELIWEIREILGEYYSKHHEYEVNTEAVKLKED